MINCVIFKYSAQLAVIFPTTLCMKKPLIGTMNAFVNWRRTEIRMYTSSFHL